MAGFSFRSSALDPLYEFHNGWNRPEREFISPALDEIRSRLWTKAGEYIALIDLETVPAYIQGRQTVPAELEERAPKRFWRVGNGLHELARQIVDIHRELVRTGRHELIAIANTHS